MYPHTQAYRRTQAHGHTHIYTKFIHTFLYTDPHGKKYNGFFSYIHIYMMRVCMCVYRKYIYKNTMTTFSYYATTALYCTAYIGTAACESEEK